jgi:hypothetical protein
VREVPRLFGVIMVNVSGVPLDRLRKGKVKALYRSDHETRI